MKQVIAHREHASCPAIARAADMSAAWKFEATDPVPRL